MSARLKKLYFQCDFRPQGIYGQVVGRKASWPEFAGRCIRRRDDEEAAAKHLLPKQSSCQTSWSAENEWGCDEHSLLSNTRLWQSI